MSEAVSCGLAGGLHQPSDPTCFHLLSGGWEQGCCWKLLEKNEEASSEVLEDLS